MKPPCVVLDLDRPRVWQFDMNASIGLLRRLGPQGFDRLLALDAKSKADAAERLEVGLTLLWAGLRSDDENLGKPDELTVERLGSLLTLEQLGPLIQQIVPVYTSATPEKPAADGENPPSPLVQSETAGAG